MAGIDPSPTRMLPVGSHQTRDQRPPVLGQWLVSVQDLQEAKLAARFGVDLLDLKEPGAGPLAPTTLETWRQVAHYQRLSVGNADHNQLQRHCRLSAALGEIDQAVSIAPTLPSDFEFAKAGPSEITQPNLLKSAWSTLRSRLPRSVELVAVAYADHEAANSLNVETILRTAAQIGFRRILIDTFDKSRGSSVEILGAARLSAFARTAADARLWWSLAGSVKLAHVAEIRTLFQGTPWGPDCAAVRGDLCRDGREGQLCPIRMQAWADVVGQQNNAMR